MSVPHCISPTLQCLVSYRHVTSELLQGALVPLATPHSTGNYRKGVRPKKHTTYALANWAARTLLLIDDYTPEDYVFTLRLTVRLEGQRAPWSVILTHCLFTVLGIYHAKVTKWPDPIVVGRRWSPVEQNTEPTSKITVLTTPRFAPTLEPIMLTFLHTQQSISL
jgi:hypothetical protein